MTEEECAGHRCAQGSACPFHPCWRIHVYMSWRMPFIFRPSWSSCACSCCIYVYRHICIPQVSRKFKQSSPTFWSLSFKRPFESDHSFFGGNCVCNRLFNLQFYFTTKTYQINVSKIPQRTFFMFLLFKIFGNFSEEFIFLII